MIIRAANPSDLLPLAHLRNALWPEKILAQFFGGGQSRIDHLLIALDAADRHVGFAELRVRNCAEGSPNHQVPFLEGWFVIPEYRREGIGTALIRGVESWATGLGYTELASNSMLGNIRSLEAHAAVGFEEVVRTVNFIKAL